MTGKDFCKKVTFKAYDHRIANVGEYASETSTKGTMDPEGSASNRVTAGHCTRVELSSGHASASCYSCCVHSRGLC